MRAGAPLAILLLFLPTAQAEDRPLRLGIGELRALPALSDETSGKAFALLGQVQFAVEGLFSVRADAAVLWIDPRAEKRLFDLLGAGEQIFPAWAVRALYAEGGGSAAVFQAEGRIFRCSSFYYDFQRHRGTFLDADLRLRIDAESIDPLVFRARRFRALGPGDLRGEDVIISSSTYHDPPVRLHAGRLRLRDKELQKALENLTQVGAEGSEGMSGPTRAEMERAMIAVESAAIGIGSKRLDLYDITGRAGDLAFFRWPKAAVSGDMLPALRLELEAGGRGRLGTGARIGVGQDLHLSADEKLEYMVGAGYYPERGPLFDVEIQPTLLDGDLTGRTFSSYLHDHGDDHGVDPSTPNRWWVKNQYRWRLGPLWRLDGEFADLSDSEWLRTYDEQEFKEGKEQESLLYLRRKGDHGYLTAITKFRSISFQDVTEELPVIAWSMPNVQLLPAGAAPLQLAFDAQGGMLRYRPAAGTPEPGFETWRLDVNPLLLLPLSAGPLRIVPYAGLRLTAYDQTLASSSSWRTAGVAGLRTDTQLSRWYGDTLHLVNVSLEAEDLYHLSVDADELFPLDEIDRVSRYESVGLRLRNRLRRYGELWSRFDFEIFFSWFPNGRQPEGRTGDHYLELDLEWRIRDNLSISHRAGIDTEDGVLETASLEGWWDPSANVRAGSGIRHLEGDSDVFSNKVEVLVDTRWRVVGFSQVDLKNGDWLDQGVLVQRLGQTVVVGVKVSFDPGDNDLRVSLSVDLLARLRRRMAKDRLAERQFTRDEIGWQ